MHYVPLVPLGTQYCVKVALPAYGVGPGCTGGEVTPPWPQVRYEPGTAVGLAFKQLSSLEGCTYLQKEDRFCF